MNPNGKPLRLQTRVGSAPWAVLICGALLSLGIGWQLWRQAERLDAARFEADVRALQQQLDANTERYTLELGRVADNLSVNQENLSQDLWNETVSRLSPAAELPALIELSFRTNAKVALLEELERTRGTNEAGEFTLAKKVLAAPSTNLVCAFHWTNRSLIKAADTQTWLDQLEIYEGTYRKIFNGRMISSPRRMLQRIDGSVAPAVSFLLPVFADDMIIEIGKYAPENQAAFREARLTGLLLGTIGWPEFLDTALPPRDEVSFVAATTVDFDPDSWMSEKAEVEQALRATENSTLRQKVEWPLYRRRWTLLFHATDRFYAESNYGSAYAAFGGGTLLSILVAGLLGAEIRARQKQEAIASQLRAALDELEIARHEYAQLTRDLHDGTIQSLYALQLGISRAREQAQVLSPPLAGRLADYRRNISAVIGELRGFIMRHEASRPNEGDLFSVLSAILQRLQASTEIRLRPELSKDAAELITQEQAVQLANIAHEGLSNALRHANPGQIIVSLRCEPDGVTLEIRDDGCGFDMANPPHRGMGLESMKSRATEIGAHFTMRSTPGHGAEIRIVLPVACAILPGQP